MLQVPEGQALSLVGGDITVQAGTLEDGTMQARQPSGAGWPDQSGVCGLAWRGACPELPNRSEYQRSIVHHDGDGDDQRRRDTGRERPA